MTKKLFYLLIPILTFFCIQTVNAGTFTDIWDTTGFNYNQFYWQQTGTLNKHQSSVFEFVKRDNSLNASGTYTFTWFLDFPRQKTTLDCNNQIGEQLCVGYDFVTTSGNISSQFSLSAENCLTNLASTSGGTYIFNSVCQVSDTTVNQGIIDIIITSNANINVDYTFGMAYRYGYFPKDSTQDDIKKNTDIINSNVNDIKDTINSNDTSGAKTDFDNIMNDNSFDVNDSPISSLVTLPLKILNVYNNAVSSSTYSCPSLDMGKMFGVNWLQMPCIYPEKYLGSTLWSIIDIVTTALLLWSLSHQLIKVYINFTSLDGRMTEKIVTQTGGML